VVAPADTSPTINVLRIRWCADEMRSAGVLFSAALRSEQEK